MHSGRVGATAASLLSLLLPVAVTVAVLAGGSPNTGRWHLLALIGLDWLVFALAAWLVLRMPRERAVPLILLGAVVLQAVAVVAPPRMTNDYFRYAWDGRVQAAGTDPYRYEAVDPALAPLRTPWLFPTRCQDRVPVCTNMNHPTSPTIYPPVAEGWFLVMHAASLGGRGHRLSLQVGAGLLAVLTTVLLLRILGRRSDPRRAVLWAWCPTVVLEAGNNAHVDVLGALLAVACLGLAAHARGSRRDGWAGVALGAAFAAKLLPALIGAALLRRAPRRVAVIVLAAAATVVLVYLPHVAAVGTHVVGFLPGYLQEEGYAGTGRFAVLRLALPPTAATVAAVLVLAVTAALTAWRSDPVRPWRAALVLTGVTFIVLGPAYPWYAVLLVALVALDGRWEWLVVALAAYPAYFVGALGLHHRPTQQLAYGTAALVVLAVTTWRRRRPAADEQDGEYARRHTGSGAPMD